MANLVMTSSTSNCTNDWDLDAIIRGSWGGGCGMVVEETAETTWQGFDFSSVEELETTATVLNELEELYKPFLMVDQPTPLSSEGLTATTTTATTSSSSPTAKSNGSDDGIDKPDVIMMPAGDEHYTVPRASSKPRGRKRNKKQNIRVVELSVGDEKENLMNMDEWNWRKYGQKSIKGSPYPRSYYRCSSLRGCEARRQVEQSIKYPYNYIVTYIGDHAHPFPARPRSLPAARKLPYSTSSPSAATAHWQ